uniref:Uncharacterized protein n=1 Tax=Aegilops tauschii subsp. strangulata TaxID=200361 RepID=A0A453Q6P1_AEGTS
VPNLLVKHPPNFGASALTPQEIECWRCIHELTELRMAPKPSASSSSRKQRAVSLPFANITKMYH